MKSVMQTFLADRTIMLRDLRPSPSSSVCLSVCNVVYCG